MSFGNDEFLLHPSILLLFACVTVSLPRVLHVDNVVHPGVIQQRRTAFGLTGHGRWPSHGGNDSPQTLVALSTQTSINVLINVSLSAVGACPSNNRGISARLSKPMEFGSNAPWRQSGKPLPWPMNTECSSELDGLAHLRSEG